MLRKIFFLFLLLNLQILEAKNSEGITLVLGGGGAKGFAHLGVLKILEENNIPIKCVVGTSMGAIVGSLIAAGYNYSEIYELFEKNSWQESIYKDSKKRNLMPFLEKRYEGFSIFDLELRLGKSGFEFPSGLIHGQDLSRWLRYAFRDVATVEDFRQLSIPFFAIATDLKSSDQIVLHDGSLVKAVRASSSYPGVFAPISIDGKILVDGGLVNNVPADVALEQCGRPVISVDVISQVSDEDFGGASLFKVSDQSFSIMIQRSSMKAKKFSDLMILPQTQFVSTFEFDRWKEIIPYGESAAIEQVSQLKKYSTEIKQNFKNKLNISDVKKIKSVHILSKSKEEKNNDLDILSKEGNKFSAPQLEQDVDTIYASNRFNSVDYRVKKTSEGIDLLFDVDEKIPYPLNFRMNLSWEGEIQGKQDGNATLSVYSKELNAFRGRWYADITVGTRLILDSFFRQPLDSFNLFFIEPRFIASRFNQDFFKDHERLTKYELDKVRGEFSFGLTPYRNFELRAGIGAGIINAEVGLGQSLPTVSDREAFYFFRGVWDSLDHISFPKSGFYLASQWKKTKADLKYQAWQNYFVVVQSVGDFHFFLKEEFSTSLGENLPVYDEFRGGGLRSFAGYREDELRGKILITHRLGTQIKLPLPKTLIWNQIFLEAFGDFGGSYNKKSELSWKNSEWGAGAGLAFDTNIGSLHLIYGQSGIDSKQFYMSVGKSFMIPDFK